MAKYYTRHQSLKHIWYQRYNSRSSSRWDGVVPWYAKKGFKSEAWRAGCESAWNQLMEERELLFNNENHVNAEIVDIERTKSGSIKLWVNVNNPYAEKWDFGDINKVTIRKNKEKQFLAKYGKPEIGKVINVTLESYHREGNSGFSYKIQYDKSELYQNESKEKYEGRENMYEKPVNFDKDDYDKLYEAIQENIRGLSLVETAIISEDKEAFNKGIQCLTNSIRYAKNVDYNRSNYTRRHKYFVENIIASSRVGICQANVNWYKTIKIPNASEEEKKPLYKKLGELQLEYAKSFKELGEIRLESAEEKDILDYKGCMYNSFWQTTLAYRSFYLAEPKEEYIEFIMKFAEKSFDMLRKLSPEARKFDDANSENVMAELEKLYQESGNSKEAKEKFIDKFISF